MVQIVSGLISDNALSPDQNSIALEASPDLRSSRINNLPPLSPGKVGFQILREYRESQSPSLRLIYLDLLRDCGDDIRAEEILRERGCNEEISEHLLGSLKPLGKVNARWQDGFAIALSQTADEFLKISATDPEFLLDHPVFSLRLTNVGVTHLRKLCKCEALQGINRIELGVSGISHDGAHLIRDFAASPCLEDCRTLIITDQNTAQLPLNLSVKENLPPFLAVRKNQALRQILSFSASWLDEDPLSLESSLCRVPQNVRENYSILLELGEGEGAFNSRYLAQIHWVLNRLENYFTILDDVADAGLMFSTQETLSEMADGLARSYGMLPSLDYENAIRRALEIPPPNDGRILQRPHEDLMTLCKAIAKIETEGAFQAAEGSQHWRDSLERLLLSSYVFTRRDNSGSPRSEQ